MAKRPARTGVELAVLALRFGAAVLLALSIGLELLSKR
jgi:hypothetical protein